MSEYVEYADKKKRHTTQDLHINFIRWTEGYQSPPMSDRIVTLKRIRASPDFGTLGELETDTGFKCDTIERYWYDNQVNVSCVPVGDYECMWLFSPHFNCNLYHILNVLGRDLIMIHPMNVFEESEGCMGLGKGVQPFLKDSIRLGIPGSDHLGITDSVETVSSFEKEMRDKNGDQEDFVLRIS